MQALTKKPRIEAPHVLTVACPPGSYQTVLTFLHQAGCRIDEDVDPSVVFPDSSPGTNLRGLRYREDLTQAALAKLSGIPRNHISEMENGKRPIGRQTARKLAEVLNTDPRMFLSA